MRPVRVAAWALEKYWSDKIALVWTMNDIHKAANERGLALTKQEAKALLDDLAKHYKYFSSFSLALSRSFRSGLSALSWACRCSGFIGMKFGNAAGFAIHRTDFPCVRQNVFHILVDDLNGQAGWNVPDVSDYAVLDGDVDGVLIH